MITQHVNFTQADKLTVQSHVHESCGPLVTITEYAGSCSFNFAMTPEQAREFGRALLVHADELAELAIQ